MLVDLNVVGIGWELNIYPGTMKTAVDCLQTLRQFMVIKSDAD